MTEQFNTQVIYTQVPTGFPDPATTFQVKRVPFNPHDVELSPNHLLVRTLYLSVDPYQRGRMRDPEIKSYLPAATLGAPFQGGAIVEVIKSTDPEKFKEGEVLVAFSNWEEFTIIPSSSPFQPVTHIPNARQSKFPLSFHLGVFGLPGATAYVGLHKYCEPLTPGQTLFVSAAAGAVGQLVGQYGKTLGLRVVGSTGSDDKVDFLLKELGFDDAFNYKKYSQRKDLVTILKKTCPNGIDIYFENVGGQMLEAVLDVANDFARVAVCGMISQYNRTQNPEGIHNLGLLISKRIKLQGFLVRDHLVEYGAQSAATFSALLSAGKMKCKETITEGIQNAPKAFADMLNGKNFGKAIVKVADCEFANGKTQHCLFEMISTDCFPFK